MSCGVCQQFLGFKTDWPRPFLESSRPHIDDCCCGRNVPEGQLAADESLRVLTSSYR